MRRAISLYRTSIGKKYVMAATAVILFVFVIGHLMGNLKIFLGPEHFNEYGEFLRTVGAPIFGRGWLLWVARIVLLASVGLHIVAYLQLWAKDRSARRVGYRKYDPDVFSRASLAMKWGGITIFFFVIWHLLDLTFGTVNPHFVLGDPYDNVIATFQRWWVAAFYIAAVVALGLHLYHGIWSTFQTLGANNPRYNRFRRPTALVIAVLVTLGYASIPVAVLLGVLS